MKFSAAFLCLSGLSLWAADSTPLNIKPGEWEYTVTTQMAGLTQSAPAQMPQIPPEQLAKLPPEQRARIEAAMKQYGSMASGKPTTTTTKNCVKKEDLASFNPANAPKSCKTTVTQSSSTRFEAKMICETQEMKTTGTMAAEAVSPESFKFNMTTTGSASGHPLNMTINGTGKWLSSTCTDEK